MRRLHPRRLQLAAATAVAALTAAAGGAWAPTAEATTPAGPVQVERVAADDAPTSASIIIGKDAQDKGYQTTTVRMAQGGSLSVVNFDSMSHTVTSQETDSSGKPLFDTFVSAGSTLAIPAASKLAPGTYTFFCRFHPSAMRGTLTIVGSGGGVEPTPQTFDQPLFIPPVLTKAHLRIPVRKTGVQVLPNGPKTQMWTYDGSYPGPTIMRPAGHDTRVTYVNHLPRRAGSITVHFHGDHHRSADDGQPTRHLIHRGHSRTYDYPLTDGGRPERAAFEYYHDHRMDRTSRNNWYGLQGLFLVTDGKSRELRLPRGRYDVPLLVSNRTFTADNQLVDPFPKHPTMQMTGPHAPPNDGTVGDQNLVNGRFAPYLKVAAHRYRLRLLNASNFTSYDFALSDGRPFVQVGTGNGLLPKPVVRQDILLGPAQRADVVVDFHRALHKRIELESIPRVDAPTGGAGSPSAQLMQFRVTRTAADHTKLPDRLQAPPPIKVPHKVSARWDFGLTGDPETGSMWTVNGRPFDPNRVDYTVPLGSTQVWKIHNSSPVTHYIHIHEEQWHTVSRDGDKPPPWERGLEDTWRLDPGETVKVAGTFTDYTGVFMIHCHMLDHEDHGMMAQFAVVKPGKGLPKGYVKSDSASTSVRRAAGPAPVVGAIAAFSASSQFRCDLDGPEHGQRRLQSA